MEFYVREKFDELSEKFLEVLRYFHATTLYNSIYRFDDEMLVNTHLFGTPAAYAPILHLRRLAGGEVFDNYTASFNQVLSRSRAVWPED